MDALLAVFVLMYCGVHLAPILLAKRQEGARATTIEIVQAVLYVLAIVWTLYHYHEALW